MPEGVMLEGLLRIVKIDKKDYFSTDSNGK
jgi:hypothetical protein